MRDWREINRRGFNIFGRLCGVAFVIVGSVMAVIGALVPYEDRVLSVGLPLVTAVLGVLLVTAKPRKK